jgi:hypothetical protein
MIKNKESFTCKVEIDYLSVDFTLSEPDFEHSVCIRLAVAFINVSLEVNSMIDFVKSRGPPEITFFQIFWVKLRTSSG